MFHFQCLCGKRLCAPRDLISHLLTCSGCGQLMRISDLPSAPAEARLEFRFVVERGPDRIGEHVLFGGMETLAVGRSRQAQVLLLGEHVSRIHARLQPTHSGWRVDDAGRTAGVFVNGERVARHDLQPGDHVQIGPYLLRYEIAEDSVAGLFNIDPGKYPPVPELAPLAATSGGRTPPPPTAADVVITLKPEDSHAGV